MTRGLILGRGNSKYKDPENGTYVACSKSSKYANVAKANEEESRSRWVWKVGVIVCRSCKAFLSVIMTLEITPSEMEGH